MSEFSDEELGRFETLVRVVELLRSPEGCPWDREQTHSSLRQYAVEEAYEVADAIESGDGKRLREELGDLLLQVVLHAQIGAEGGEFDIEGVIRSINEKLIRRHRWVFGQEEADSPQAALRSWNRVKAEERGYTEKEAPLLDAVSGGLPALFTALRLTRRAAEVGFDWPRIEDVVAKLREEVGEIERAVADGNAAEVEGEIGDILFVLANAARHLGVNPELALERSNRKFRRRFSYVEEKLAERGRRPDESDLQEMDALWDEAKAHEID